jgi:hypothetical protein
MNVLKWAAAGLVGGLVAAAVWAGLHASTGRDLGWIAWIVGGVAGVCVRLAAGRVRGEEPALVGVAVAVIALLGGKLAGGVVDVRRQMAPGSSERAGLLADLSKPTAFDRSPTSALDQVAGSNGAPPSEPRDEYARGEPDAAPERAWTDDTLANAVAPGATGPAASPAGADSTTPGAPAPGAGPETPAGTGRDAAGAAAPAQSLPVQRPAIRVAEQDRPLTKDVVVAFATLPDSFEWTDAVWFGLAVVTAYLFAGGGAETGRRAPEAAAS